MPVFMVNTLYPIVIRSLSSGLASGEGIRLELKEESAVDSFRGASEGKG